MTTISGSSEVQDFSSARHTVVLSDVHLADAEPPHPKNPFWKRFKRPRFFIDRKFMAFLEAIQKKADGPIELVLNGDIFDFDSVMKLPEKPPFKVSWIERRRGLAPEEAKSRFKIRVILEDHKVWTQAIRDFILKGNRVVFIIGNHDIELHWPTVQQDIVEILDLPEHRRSQVRFCEWFYISNKDTMIEHGNQYDSYCLNHDPVHPLIRKGQKDLMRIPFGNLAGKYMVNGIGLLNPHVDSSFIRDLKGHLIFFYKYQMRTQPLVLWTWFWSATATFIHSVTEGLLPSMRDPLTVETRVEEIASKANTTPRVVRSLRELHAHPAIYSPVKILKELWLDRAFLVLFIMFVSFEIFTLLGLFVSVSIWWFLIPCALLFPPFLFYARSVQSDVPQAERSAISALPLITQITHVKRVIFGHTHREMHLWVEGVELLNTGTWSPAFRDVECTQPEGRKCFAWVKPNPKGDGRIAELYEWREDGTMGPLLPDALRGLDRTKKVSAEG